MYKEDLKKLADEIRPRWRELYPADKCGKGITCPLCGSGQGKNRTGITENKGASTPGMLKCWHAGCAFNDGGDVIKLIELEQGLSFPDAVIYAADKLGIVHDIPDGSKQAQPGKSRKSDTYDSQYRLWTAGLQIPDSPGAAYLASRGISVSTAVRKNVGYISDWISPTSKAHGYKGPGSPRIIFPKGSSAYATRDIRPAAEMPESARKYIKQNEGKGGLFGAEVLDRAGDVPVFITEGPMDALSVEEAGIPALALCGTSGQAELIKQLKDADARPLLILALDNDEPGRLAASQLEEKLAALDLPCVLCADDLYLGTKDLNEALCKDAELFRRAVRKNAENARTRMEENRQAELQKYENTYSTDAGMDQFEERTRLGEGCGTGYAELDEILDGGLYPGLYILGAVSSLGKTTFALQMMDQIAAAGTDVLLFSLEMSRDELTAKSLSRISYQLGKERYERDNTLALTTRDILTRRPYYSEASRTLYNDARSQYREQIACRQYVFEGNGDIGVQEVSEMVRQHIRITGRRPVVLIDYLQILAPAEMRATDKQNTDRAVFAAKVLSRELSVPVLAISSFNRDNYASPVSHASFKESGAIEYSSDVLLGLQYAGMDRHPGEADQAYKERIRSIQPDNEVRIQNGESIDIELKVLKNRNGRRGRILFHFQPRYNAFWSDIEYVRQAVPLADDGYEDF